METQRLDSSGRSTRLVPVVLPLLHGSPPARRGPQADQALESDPSPRAAAAEILRARRPALPSPSAAGALALGLRQPKDLICLRCLRAPRRFQALGSRPRPSRGDGPQLKLLCSYRSPTGAATAPSGTYCIDGGNSQTGGKHLPAGPYAGIEIEYRFQHAERRDTKGQPDAARFAEKGHDRHREREREQGQGRQLSHILPPRDHTVSNQPKEKTGGEGRHRDIRFCLLEVMDEREQGDRVHRLVQTSPAQCAQPAHHAIGRGCSEHSETDPCYGADDQINAMRDLMNELGGIVALVRKEEDEMRRYIAKRADAEHSSYVDEAAVAQDLPERCHRQRQPKKHQRPKAGTMNQIVERTRAVRDFTCLDNGLDERH